MIKLTSRMYGMTQLYFGAIVTGLRPQTDSSSNQIVIVSVKSEYILENKTKRAISEMFANML